MAGHDDGAPKETSDAGLILLYPPDLSSSPRGFALGARAHVVGRDAGDDRFALPMPSVSRMHAVVQRGRAGVAIKDLGSRNGTFVRGERVSERALRSGDDVRIGDALFVFVDRDARQHLRYRLDGALDEGAEPITIEGLAGGWSMAQLSREVDATARSAAAVLLLGETGAGKELVARGVHRASRRRGPFVPVNCAALSPHLVESTMFGHERGAFTGADKRHDGLVRSAHGGTLFLDEIGDLGLDAQAKLLRTLESREVLPVGATKASVVDVRFVCATHRDLIALVRAGSFRADLYARIAGHTISIPPLRARKEDLLLLLRHLLARFDAPRRQASFAFVYRLVRHDWPFNVRELAQAVQFALSHATDDELRSQHLPKELGQAIAETASSPEVAAAPRKRSPSAVELRALMREHGGNVSSVARALTRDAAQIYRWLRRYGIDPTSFRDE